MISILVLLSPFTYLNGCGTARTFLPAGHFAFDVKQHLPRMRRRPSPDYLLVNHNVRHTRYLSQVSCARPESVTIRSLPFRPVDRHDSAVSSSSVDAHPVRRRFLCPPSIPWTVGSTSGVCTWLRPLATDGRPTRPSQVIRRNLLVGPTPLPRGISCSLSTLSALGAPDVVPYVVYLHLSYLYTTI